MKSSHAVVLALAAALVPAVLHAADAPKPNTLTPKEISDGWILLFDGETAFGWKADTSASDPPAGLEPKVRDGVLDFSNQPGVTTLTTSEFCCFELSFDYAGAGKAPELVLDKQKIALPPTGGRDKWATAQVSTEVKDGKRIVRAAFTPAGKEPAKPKDVAKSDSPGRTAIAFGPPGVDLRLRNVKLKPINLKSLFNGKNLDGWYPVEGHASKFSVTDKGELNIKNGNGEIKTEGEWADFVLQLDVFSNGQHLNSGVFFRDLPGKGEDTFWQGYEAQIRNEWDGYSGNQKAAEKKEDRAKPIDFGTGGLYNRQPSRKVVSSDKEWFTYTILANGKHIALWVNGFQTTDYVDNEKDAKSARQGRFLGKGCISLQGHDPTTDLSFRNIRLQELPSTK